MDDFFSIASKAVMIVPIVIVIFALVLKFNEKPIKIYNRIDGISPTVTIKPRNTKKVSIDFEGPLVCHYKMEGQEYRVYIKNRQIRLVVKSGEKTNELDLSKYVANMEGVLATNDITSLEELIYRYTSKKVDVQEIVNSCKKEIF